MPSDWGKKIKNQGLSVDRVNDSDPSSAVGALTSALPEAVSTSCDDEGQLPGGQPERDVTVDPDRFARSAGSSRLLRWPAGRAGATGCRCRGSASAPRDRRHRGYA